MSVDESGCTARGVSADADGLLCDIAGSDSRDGKSCSGDLSKILA